MSKQSDKYQVGDLIHFEKGDPLFDDMDLAIEHAISKSNDEEATLGIWNYDNGELVAIVHEGQLFT